MQESGHGWSGVHRKYLCHLHNASVKRTVLILKHLFKTRSSSITKQTIHIYKCGQIQFLECRIPCPTRYSFIEKACCRERGSAPGDEVHFRLDFFSRELCPPPLPHHTDTHSHRSQVDAETGKRMSDRSHRIRPSATNKARLCRAASTASCTHHTPCSLSLIPT